MDNGRITNSMVKESILKKIILPIRVTLQMENTMALELWSTKMEINMKVNFKMGKNMEMVSIHGKMVITMMDNGKTTALMGMELP